VQSAALLAAALGNFALKLQQQWQAQQLPAHPAQQQQAPQLPLGRAMELCAAGCLIFNGLLALAQSRQLTLQKDSDWVNFLASTGGHVAGAGARMDRPCSSLHMQCPASDSWYPGRVQPRVPN